MIACFQELASAVVCARAAAEDAFSSLSEDAMLGDKTKYANGAAATAQMS